MSEVTVAARYAKALIDLAQEQNAVEAMKNDMELFHHTLRVNPELKAVLANPIVSHTKKIKILDEVFSGKVGKASITFFKLMVNKSRGEVLYTTAQEYINMYDVKNHIIHANVVSATELSAENKKKNDSRYTGGYRGHHKIKCKSRPIVNWRVCFNCWRQGGGYQHCQRSEKIKKGICQKGDFYLKLKTAKIKFKNGRGKTRRSIGNFASAISRLQVRI